MTKQRAKQQGGAHAAEPPEATESEGADTKPGAPGWDFSTHDPPPPADFLFDPLETHVYLMAFLAAEGSEWNVPYTPVRQQIESLVVASEARKRGGQAPSAMVGDSRLRTWLTLFERFGFLYDDASEGSRVIRLTPLGRAARDLYGEINNTVASANDKLAALAITTLGRQLLNNPFDPGVYPEGSDILPFRFIWRAMRQLGDKLHYEELNRVIMRTLRRDDEPAAIARIRAVRERHGGIYNGLVAGDLGRPVVPIDHETVRRLSVWFARAGFGGLLIRAEMDSDGYRHLVPEQIPAIDEELETDPVVPVGATASELSYIAYVTLRVAATVATPRTGDAAKLTEIRDAIKRYGTSKIIALSGLPGTGKSYLARLAAMECVDNDTYRFDEVQFHEGTSYDDFMEGFVPRPDGQGFELKPKTFRLINRRARLDTGRRSYVLLIEEFTRTNVHAVLGELMTYVEHRNRPFRLPLSQSEERIAPNLVILATMNPRDKSALVLDQAILRRIHQIEVGPSIEGLRAVLRESPDEAKRMDDTVFDQLRAWFEGHLNELPFGHAVFAGALTAGDLRELWRGTLRHFLLDSAGNVRERYRSFESTFPWP